MKKVEKWILQLAVGEFAAAAMFVLVYIQVNKLSNLGSASLMTFSYLIFILLQGSMYWLYRYVLIKRRVNYGHRAIIILRFLKGLNLLLLMVIGILTPFIQEGIFDSIVAIGLFIFGIVEYINYYYYRLSYGKSGFNIKKLIKTGLKKSSINKMIDK